jgi:hypothetical protein
VDKIPLLSTFDKALMAFLKEVKKYYREKPVILILYLIFCLSTLAVAVFGILIVAKNGVEAYRYFNPAPIPSNTPFKVLTYTRTDRVKDNEGIYHSSYKIYVHTPAGNGTDTYLKNNLKDAECSVNNAVSILTTFRAGIASTTEVYEAACLSKEPIIDNGSIFEVRNEYN